MRTEYRGQYTREISFPLGGLGTGCIGLGGNGRLIDWEIFNRPAKNTSNGFSHFAIKAERDGRVLDARVLNSDLQAPYTGQQSKAYSGFGFGPDRSTMAGVPHFKDAVFKGEFPFAEMDFLDDSFPGRVSLMAYNPFIPGNDKDSGIPGAFFELEVENTTGEDIDYTLLLSVNNPMPAGTDINRYEGFEGLHFMTLSSNKYGEDQPEYGTITFGTDAAEVSYQEYWYRGGWFDSLGIYWRDLITPGPLKNRTYPAPEPPPPGVPMTPGADVATLAARVTLSSGETKRVRYVIAWYYPNAVNYWNPVPEEPKATEPCGCGNGCCDQKAEVTATTWRNHYATVFKGSWDTALYALNNWRVLYDDTKLFKDALYSSSIPGEGLEAIAANLSILKSPTCLRLADGSFYGWEGCHCEGGCCEGSCTHVWNYAYALPFLFPALERSMRNLEYKYNQRDDGGLCFRLQLPLGRGLGWSMPCADGQFGGIIKVYREWRISGDTEWLRGLWPGVKGSIEFAWAETNECKWDPGKTGVLWGRQHHTLDMELFGPNSWLTGFYLAALKAGAEMAEHLGEPETAVEWRDIFNRGKAWVEANLFNGDYYQQLLDITDESVLEPFDAVGTYWNSEAGEIKYQIAGGSSIDQILAQWHADLCGLGEIFDTQRVRKSLESVFRNNFKDPVGGHFNACRLYSLNDEKGLAICDWPEGTYKPAVPIVYAEETMNGFEYQAAIHMVRHGMHEEGFTAIKAVRDRYDGFRRNPWNEFECGSNYARSMASYALLPMMSGFAFDMVRGMIGFNPLGVDEGPKTFFWSLDSGWGTFAWDPARGAELKVLHGELGLKELWLPFIAPVDVRGVGINGRPLGYTCSDGSLCFETSCFLEAGDGLSVNLFGGC